MNNLEAVKAYRANRIWLDFSSRYPVPVPGKDYPLGQKAADTLARTNKRRAAVDARARHIIEQAENAAALLPRDCERDFIKLYFFQGLPAEQVADALFMSLSTLYRVRGAAIKNLSAGSGVKKNSTGKKS